MKRFLLTAVFLSFTVLSSAQQKEWTLQECISNMHLKITLQLSNLILMLNLPIYKISDAFGNFLPGVNASASNSWNTGLTQNVTTGILQTQTTRNFSAGVTAGITFLTVKKF